MNTAGTIDKVRGRDQGEMNGTTSEVSESAYLVLSDDLARLVAFLPLFLGKKFWLQNFSLGKT